jgi:hypothetical protein
VKKVRILLVGGLVLAMAAMPGMAAAGPGKADGRCVATGAGFTFDGPTKASVAKAGLMKTIILDHAFNNADVTEELLGIEICN